MNQDVQVTQEVAIAPLTELQKKAWLSLAAKKNEVTALIQKRGLSLQQIILSIEKENNYKTIDTALAKYSKVWSELSEYRKSEFTAVIQDKIIAPIIALEKQYAPSHSQMYIAAAERSLQLRKEEEARAYAANKIAAIKSSFKAHVLSERARIEEDYRKDLKAYVTRTYRECIEQELPTVNIEEIVKEMSAIKPIIKMQPFDITTIGKEAAAEILKEMKPLNTARVLQECIGDMKEMFSDYAHALANAQEAIKYMEAKAKEEEEERKRRLEEEQAMNTLITKSEAVDIEVPKIRRTLVVVDKNNEAWAKAVMYNFITELPHLIKYIRAKSWGTLRISQMAEYLGKYATQEGVTFSGLELEEKEK